MTNEAKHTPGPWEFHGRINDDLTHDGSILADVASGRARCVAKAPRYESEVQWIANASLIATAPELLEALEDEVRHMRASGGEPSERTIEVIAKAKNANGADLL